jgi:hypothetical protein
MLVATGNNHNDNIFTNNWTDIINQDARSMDDEHLGKVKGLYDPFIVLEKGTINKQKLYIPRSFIDYSSGDEIYFSVTKQEAKDTYRRESPPTEDEIRQIETITENRIVASRRDIGIITKQNRTGEAELRQRPRTEEKKMMIVNKIKEFKNHVKTITLALTSISIPRTDKEEIVKKLTHSVIKVRKILVSAAEVAKGNIKRGKDIAEEKIKEQQEAAEEERKAENNPRKISKIGNLTLQFSHSFDGIVSEVSSSRSDTGQEQIYKGFARLIGLPGKILVAGKKLAAKLKDSFT